MREGVVKGTGVEPSIQRMNIPSAVTAFLLQPVLLPPGISNA